jgi:hypothetical protein
VLTGRGFLAQKIIAILTAGFIYLQEFSASKKKLYNDKTSRSRILPFALYAGGCPTRPLAAAC